MAIFQDVTLGWKGEEKTIPANQIMRLIAKIEDEVTIQDLTREGGPKMTSVAFGYTTALNYAGFSVNVDEVYESLFTDAGSATGAVTGLLTLMMPPSTYQPQGKPQAETQEKPASSQG